MIICSQCGFICADTARNCGDCGAAISFNPAAGVNSAPYTPQQAATGQPYAHRGEYVAQPSPPVVGPSKATNHLLWILPLGILLVLAIAIGLTTSKRAASSSTADTSPSPAAPTVTPYPTNGRLVYCKFNGVHVRALPNLDAYIITDVQQGQPVRVFRESSNYDTVFVRSINQSVTDNWSEIQVENTSIRGWIFSGFLR